MAFFDGAAKQHKSRITHLTFRLGGQLYGIPLDIVSRVVALGEMSPLKASDPAVAGEMALEDGAIVVVDMGVRLTGKPSCNGDRKCVVVVKRAKARSGCLFDAPQGAERITDSEIETCGLLAGDTEGAMAIPQGETIPVENASASGSSHGYPLYKTKSEVILLPDREFFFPQ